MFEKWAWPTFFTPATGMNDLQQDIQQQLTDLDPEIEVVALEQPRTDALRLFIDHPAGVDLGLCERVTNHLRHLLVDHSLEVSSPGPKYRDRSRTSNRKEQVQ